MTQIKIEVPANDTIALNAFAEALQRIAAERKGEQPLSREEIGNSSHKDDFDDSLLNSIDRDLHNVVTKVNQLTVQLDALEGAKHEELIEQMESFKTPKNDDYVEESPDSVVTLAGQVNQLHEQLDASGDVKVPDALPTNETIDADGIPWDKRIHSKGKSRLADDTWRLRKRPADKDENEWTTYIDTVKAELKAVQDIEAPTLDEPQATATVQLNEGVTTEQIVEALVTPPSTVTPPVAAVTPPASVTPPVIDTDTPQGMSEADEPAVKTFPELMKYITTSAAKRGANNDMIKEVLLEVDASLTAIPLIANRVDLIPVFVEKLEVRLA